MGAQPSDARPKLTRAMAAGLGSAGSLGAAAICVLLLISATIAYHSWPDSKLGDGPGSRAILDDQGIADTAPSAPPAGGGGSAATPAPTSAAPSAASTPAPGRARRRAASRRPRTPVPQGSLGPVRAGGVPQTPPTRPPAPTPTPAPTPARTIAHEAVARTGGQVRETGRTVGGELGEVSPPVGDAVTSLTHTLGTTIESLADLVP